MPVCSLARLPTSLPRASRLTSLIAFVRYDPPRAGEAVGNTTEPPTFTSTAGNRVGTAGGTGGTAGGTAGGMGGTAGGTASNRGGTACRPSRHMAQAPHAPVPAFCCGRPRGGLRRVCGTGVKWRTGKVAPPRRNTRQLWAIGQVGQLTQQ